MSFIGEGSVWFWSMLQFFFFSIYLLLIYFQLKQFNKRNFYDIAKETRETWNSEQLLEARYNVCKRYSGREKRFIGIDEEIVLGFFEDIGILERKKIIQRDLVWEYHSYNLERYYSLLKDDITEAQKIVGEASYENITRIAELMSRYKKTKENTPMTRRDLDDFIKSELAEIPEKIKNKNNSK